MSTATIQKTKLTPPAIARLWGTSTEKILAFIPSATLFNQSAPQFSTVVYKESSALADREQHTKPASTNSHFIINLFPSPIRNRHFVIDDLSIVVTGLSLHIHNLLEADI